MLRKFSNSVRRKGSGANDACKFRFDFHIDYVDGLPSKVRHCRAQLKRSPKTNISELHPASGGRCDMGETLSFVATMYRTGEGTFEPKQYTFVLQVPAKPEKPSTDKLLVLGDCVLDLARFAPNVDVSGQRLALPVPTKLKRVAQVHGTVTVTIVQAKMAVDGLTNISGTEALSSAPLGMEQDLSGFSDYDGEGGTPKTNRTRDLSSSKGLRPPLAGHSTPDGNYRSSSKTLTRLGSTSKTGRNNNTPKSKHRSASSIPATKKSPATPPSASAGRRFGTGYALSQQLSSEVPDQALHPHSASLKVNGNRTSPPAVFSQNAPSRKPALPARPEERQDDSDSSSLSEMSTGSQGSHVPAPKATIRDMGSAGDRKSPSSGHNPPHSSKAKRSPQAPSLVNGAIASSKKRDAVGSGRDNVTTADSAGSRIGAQMSAFSETTTTNEHLQRVRGKLQPMQGVQEAPDELAGDTSAMEVTGGLSRVDTDDLLEGAVEGTLSNASVMQAQEPKKFSWRRAAGAIKAQQQQRSGLNSASNSAAIGANRGTPMPQQTDIEADQGMSGRGTGLVGVSQVVAGSPPESEASTMGDSNVTGGAGAGDFDGSAAPTRKTRNGIMDADLLDDNLALPKTQGKDMFSGMVQDPLESIAPDAMMSTMQGGLSGMGGHSAMQGTLNLAPPYQLQAPKSAGSGTPVGMSSQGSVAPRSMEGDTGAARSPERAPVPLTKSLGEQQAEERAASLAKELQIEKESSQAAMLSLRNELAVEKESSNAALAQVQGELEQERARSKTAIGRVRKDLESELESVNSALTEVRADLDRERERSKTLSSTLEATAERSRTITSQLEAANKQVTELKVMRRELEGSRREIEALRKSSADGGVAQKELSSTRRELESVKKQADVARADYAEMLEEYERLKKQETKMKKLEDSLSKAHEEVDRLKKELQDARETAAETQKRHQEEKQAALERVNTITNGKDEEREKLQVQLQQQLQTSEELVQELKSRLEEKESAMRDLKSEKEVAVSDLECENKTLTNAAAEAKVLRAKLDSMTQERDKAVEEVAKLDEALEAMQNGPNAELMQAWDTERRELLQDLEAAENRVLGMQSQVAEGDMELHKLRKASEQLKREKEALQNDALQLTERTMELEHANRMLTNEMNEKKAGRAKSMRDSWSLDGGGLTPSPPPAPGGDDGKKKTKVVDKADYEKVVAELAELKLEFALGQERETIMRHEVQKARERKAQLEAKLTKVENSMYGGLARLPGAAALGNTDED